MTDEDKRLFCAHLCSAAKALGMKMGKWTDGEEYTFGFYDFNLVIKGKPSMNQKEAFYSACVELQEYFQITWNK